MSFSVEIKNEVCRIENTNLEDIAMLSAYLRQNAYIDEEVIRILTENPSICKCLFKIIKRLYDVNINITVRRSFNFNKNYIYIMEIKDKKEFILKDLSLMNDNSYFMNIPREYIIDDDESKKAYIRGCFLASGSVNNPKTSRYHLELLIDDIEYSEFINNLLLEYDLNSHIIKRKNGYMVYIKEAEKISDFLKIIKAYNAVLYFEDIRIYRDKKNITNRLNNCEQANIEKTINTALKQVEDIELISKMIGLDALDDKIGEVARFRMEYRESSLLELSVIMSHELGKKITKSGLNHRFRKIREIANNFRH